MPKKSKQYGWSCSECYPDSSGDELKPETMDFDNDEQSGHDGINRRRRQRRVAASKALLAASSSANNSDDEANIMKKVMKESAKMAKVAKNGLDEKRDDLIAKAEAKAERKRIRKEEKARRKAEKKAAEKQLQQRIMEQNGGGNDEDSDVEIIEEDNGVCTVSIGPKPIKLTIKTNGHQQKKQQLTPVKSKDLRTACDKCHEPGDNISLVRCDECKRCYHFGCLIPPLRKSPKVPGYGWHCNECDPSDRDSDWHLD